MSLSAPSGRYMRALTAGCVALLAACSSGPQQAPVPPSVLPSGDRSAMESALYQVYSKTYQQYVDALLLCGGATPKDWEDARRQLEILHPFHVFDDDPALIQAFRQGSEPARKELTRRGVVLRTLQTFGQPYDKVKWDEARRILSGAGDAAVHLMVRTLFSALLNGQYRRDWQNIRYHLIETGPIALETAMGLSDQLVQHAPADAAIFKLDDLVQTLLVAIGFGDASREFLDRVSRNPKMTVRRSVAAALGEAKHDPGVPILIRYVSEDPEWQVRVASALAMGKLSASRSVVGPALVARFGKERDALVLQTVLRSVGEVGYIDGIPELMKVLEVPNLTTAEKSMEALYILTGERFRKKELWQEWYRTRYSAWRIRQGAPPPAPK